MRREVEAELKRRGADYCHVCIFDPKQSVAMGGQPEHTIGWYSGSPCQNEAAEKAFNEAVAALKAKPQPDDAQPQPSTPDAPFNGLTAVEWIEQGMPDLPVYGGDEPEPKPNHLIQLIAVWEAADEDERQGFLMYLRKNRGVRMPQDGRSEDAPPVDGD